MRLSRKTASTKWLRRCKRLNIRYAIACLGTHWKRRTLTLQLPSERSRVLVCYNMIAFVQSTNSTLLSGHAGTEAVLRRTNTNDARCIQRAETNRYDAHEVANVSDATLAGIELAGSYPSRQISTASIACGHRFHLASKHYLFYDRLVGLPAQTICLEHTSDGPPVACFSGFHLCLLVTIERVYA